MKKFLGWAILVIMLLGITFVIPIALGTPLITALITGVIIWAIVAALAGIIALAVRLISG